MPDELSLDSVYTKLNLGCGDRPEKKFPRPWLNVNLESPYADVACDVRSLPAEWAGRFEEVRASHLLEHLYFGQWRTTLMGWIRVLRPGGLLRIIVPDLDIVVRDLARGYDDAGKAALSHRETTPVLAQLYGVGYDDPATDDRWRHRILDNREILGVVLEDVGLEEVSDYDHRDDPAFTLGIRDDSQNRFSLLMRARKPVSGKEGVDR
jgi:predicted SAM-dependent methyltransferase